MTEKSDAVWIGSGYAGVMAANCLGQRNHVTATSIDPCATIVGRICPYYLEKGTTT